MATQEKIVELNNVGVYFLTIGEDEEGLHRLQASLSMLKKLTQELKSTHNATPPSMSNFEGISRPRCSPSRDRQEPQSMSFHRGSTQCDVRPDSFYLHPSAGLSGFHHDSHNFIYNKPLAFDCLVSPQHFPFFLHFHGAAVIFNLALAYHRIGKLKMHQGCIEKALVLYDSCFELLESRAGRSGSVTLIKMAALNNSSQIRFETGDNFTARKMLHLLAVVIADAESEARAPMSDEDTEGFILNIVLFRYGMTTAAAA